MANWQDYAELHPGEHTVTGTLRVLPGVWSPQLNNRRDILVHLPHSYGETQKRYPVVYMQDGQNVFDRMTSNAGEWEADETMEAFSREGIEAIIVGIPSMGERRTAEYTPFPDEAAQGGDGNKYLDFVRGVVKPLVDTEFRTKPDRSHTAILGSSLGGLISLYAFFREPGTFGLAGVLSPAFRSVASDIFPYVQQAPLSNGKIYIDVGTREGRGLEPDTDNEDISDIYLGDAQLMYRLLREKGYTPGRDILFVEERDAVHHESAWARRLPGALRFLLSQ